MAALPLMGVGNFANTNEGFCYFDFFEPALAAILLALTLPTILSTVGLLVVSMRAEGRWPRRLDLLLMLLSFLSAWLLWVPASLIGLSQQPFPRHYMITGGVSGHAQALLNPYVYGIRWRRSALELATRADVAKVQDKDVEVAAPDLVTPATSSVVGVAGK